MNSTLIDRATSQNHKLWRSKSEVELLESEAGAKHQDTETCVKDRSQGPTQTVLQEPKHIQSLEVPSEGSEMATENLCPPRPGGEQEGEESEREETESSDDNTTQYSIHPPHDCPYLLLLQGCRPTQVPHSQVQNDCPTLSQTVPDFPRLSHCIPEFQISHPPNVVLVLHV